MARRIEGLSELNKNLARLDQRTRAEVLGESLLDAAEPIRLEAKRLTPRSDTPGGTTGKGHAADHIRSIIKEAGSIRKAQVNIGPEVDFWYLSFPEFGTPHQPALAMFRRAADAKFRDALLEFRERMQREIESAVR